jgi:hypothetical protein
LSRAAIGEKLISAEQFAEKLASSTSGAESPDRKERLYRSAESAAPPKSELFSKLFSPWVNHPQRLKPRPFKARALLGAAGEDARRTAAGTAALQMQRGRRYDGPAANKVYSGHLTSKIRHILRLRD